MHRSALGITKHPAHDLIDPERVGWSDDQLLDLPMGRLNLEIKGSFLEGPIAELDGELETRRLRFRPHYWLSNEWFTPEGVPGIAIPFYLAHPRLAELELAQMLDVEEGTPDWCLRILRHEAGHAIENAYRIRRRTRQAIFGKSSQAVQPEFRPASRCVVCTESSGRRLRRDVCRMADLGFHVA